MDPVDVFADYIFPKVGRRPKILLDLSSLGPVHNGSSRVAIPVLERFAEASQSNYQLGEFTIRAPAASIEFFRLDRFGFTVITTESTNDLFFDVGVAISPIWHLNQIHFFNLSCARWVVTHFDVISLRTHSLLETEFVRRQVVLDSVRFADDIITISEFAANDLNDFFAENFPQTSGLRTTTLTLGAHTVSDLPQHEKHAKASEECSILIIGNHFKHKQVLRAVKSLAEMGEKIVVLGGNDSHKISECVEVIGTGKLTDQEISDLYQASSCVVFPSHYEGYGLPIAEAQLHQKPMVLFDSAVSREVVEDIGFQDGAIFFSTFGELREAVCQAALIPNVRSRARRTIEDYAEDVLNLVINRAGIIVDTKQLKSRVSYFRSIVAYESREVSELTYRLDRRIYRAADRLLNSFAKLSRYFANRTKVERPANSGDMSIHGARRWT
jgi:glycosyltransferase involved in cell wall biosynthesis